MIVLERTRRQFLFHSHLDEECPVIDQGWVLGDRFDRLVHEYVSSYRSHLYLEIIFQEGSTP